MIGELYQEERANALSLPLGTGKRYNRADLEALADEADREGYSCLKEGGIGLSPLRVLTPQEKVALADVRTRMVEGNTPFVKTNTQDFQDVVEGNEKAKAMRSVTIAFDDEEKRGDFIHIVFEINRQDEITPPPIPAAYSLRLRPSLLRDLAQSCNLRPVAIEDLQKEALRRVSPYPFDTADFISHPIYELIDSLKKIY